MKAYRMKLSGLLLAIAVVAGTASCTDAKKEFIRQQVASMSEMSELGTVEYTINKIIKAEDEAFYTIGDRKIVLSCKAIIKAGIDMKDFSADNIVYDRSKNAVTVELPEPRVLSFKMPPDDVKLEDMKVDFFRSDFSAEERNELLAQGEKDIKADVGKMGILEDARKNARSFFVLMFAQAGISKVEVKFV